MAVIGIHKFANLYHLSILQDVLARKGSILLGSLLEKACHISMTRLLFVALMI
jgi:hypothetical protein